VTLSIRGFSSVVTSAVAPIATGWSEPVPGRDAHPPWIGAFSRRTSKLPLGPMLSTSVIAATFLLALAHCIFETSPLRPLAGSRP